jgi:hypothetical protein
VQTEQEKMAFDACRQGITVHDANLNSLHFEKVMNHYMQGQFRYGKERLVR